MFSIRQTATLWKSGFVRRFHANPHAELRNSGDIVGGHSQRVAILYLGIFGKHEVTMDTLAHNLVTALLHDAPETLSGDIPAPAKRIVKSLGVAAADVDDEFWRKNGEVNWSDKSPAISMCDLLDVVLFVRLHKPDILKRKDWVRDMDQLISMANELNVAREVTELVNMDWSLI